MVFGETHAKRLPHAPAITPVFVHLAIVLMLGLWIPPYLTRWFQRGRAHARMTPCDSSTSPSSSTSSPASAARSGAGASANGAALQAFAVAVHRTDGRLAALWGSDERLRDGGFRLRACSESMGHAWLSLDLPADRPHLSRPRRHLSRRQPHAAGDARSGRHRPRGRRPAPLAAPRRLAGGLVPAAPRLRARAPASPTHRATTTSSRSAARAPTRFPSARSTPASSSRATSASR
jgi:hypothetical protein